MHKYVSVDVEADGPVPGLYSMLQLGAVVVEPVGDDYVITDTFSSYLSPISQAYKEDALRHGVGVTRKETLCYPDPSGVIVRFHAWLYDLTDDGQHRLIFVSDNAGFDWMFVNYYLWWLIGKNLFGHSSLSLTSLYKGYAKSMRASFKHLRKTKHTHDALDDARGNAEALIYLLTEGGLRVR